MIIHQVYGIFRDSKPMNEMFKTSSNEWFLIAKNNGWKYMLWDNRMCDMLVAYYPEFYDLYNNVRFKIMRCDIIRFLIVYQFGGIYVDMDVFPNRKDLSFITDKNKFHMCVYYWTPQYCDTNIPDIEMLYSPRKNIDLYNFIKYIPSQIEEKDKIDVYKTWKIRYVFNTTGPQSFRRFIKQNMIKFNHIKVAQIEKGIPYNIDKNKLIKYGDLNIYDCISFFSLSYNPHGSKSVRYKNNKKK